jgi:hypothetical protein
VILTPSGPGRHRRRRQPLRSDRGGQPSHCQRVPSHRLHHGPAGSYNQRGASRGLSHGPAAGGDNVGRLLGPCRRLSRSRRAAGYARAAQAKTAP